MHRMICLPCQWSSGGRLLKKRICFGNGGGGGDGGWAGGGELQILCCMSNPQFQKIPLAL